MTAQSDCTDRRLAEDEERDPAVRAAVAEVRAFVAARHAPDLTPAVRAAIEVVRIAPQRRTGVRARRWIGWCWQPRVVTVRPAFAAAAVVLMAVGLLPLTSAPVVMPLPVRPSAGPQPALEPISIPSPPAVRPQVPVAPPRVFVQFRLPVESATDVRLAGSFTGWRATHQLQETSPGIWTVTIPLAPGVHDYLFVVDGRQWTADPHAPRVADGFGGVNSRIALVVPSHEAS